MQNKLLKYVIIMMNLIPFSCWSQDGYIQNYIYNAVSGTNSEPVIYNDVNLNSYELLTGSFQFSKDNNLQKAVIAPFKIFISQEDLQIDTTATKAKKLKVYLLDALTQTRVNISQKDGVTTFGIGVGYDAGSPFSPRGNRIFREVFSGLPSFPVGPVDETTDQLNVRKETYFNNTIVPRYSDFYSSLQTAIKITVGYNVSFFDIIGGDKVDKDKDGVIDNYHTVKADDATIGIGYSLEGKWAFNINGHVGSTLTSAKETEKYAVYRGASGAVARRIAVLKRDYKKSDDYLKSLFIPSLILGTAFEYQTIIENKSYAKDGITEMMVITPFVDFKINPKVQFRVGVPIKKYSGVNEEIAFGPFIQYSLQLANKE